MQKAGYLSAFAVPVILISGYFLGGWWNWSTFIFAFLIEPGLDFVVGKEPRNVSADSEKSVADDPFYRIVTYLWVYIQVGTLVWACYVATIGVLTHWYEWTGFVLGLSIITGGIGITVAHELGHKKTFLQRFYSRLLLMTTGYMHFYIEHNRGHHVRVATPEDPATARFGESFYRFWIRSVVMGYASAWKIEAGRLEKRGQSLFSFHNHMIWYTLLPVLLWLLTTWGFSIIKGSFAVEVLILLPVQAILAFTLLELVNYVEHYGILRKESAPGKYEKVNPLHSWNADHKVSNFILFQLQRHSDHHISAAKPYQILKSHQKSPQLPASYPTMIILALLPPLWFRIVDPILLDWQTTLRQVA